MSRHVRSTRQGAPLVRRAFVLCLLATMLTVVTPHIVPGNPGAARSAEAVALRKARFIFEPEKRYQHVFLAGTFNGWSTDATPMQLVGDSFQLTMLLVEGEYQYKFVADGEWITDEAARAFNDDGFGGRNSVIVVDATFEPIATARGDGNIMTEGLAHREDAWEKMIGGDGSVTLRVRTWTGDVERVSVWLAGGAPSGYRMELVDSDGRYDYFSRELAVGDSFDYRFALTDGETVLWLGPLGIVPSEEMERAGYYELRMLDSVAFETPDWVKEGIFYQIFPERFRNGDTSNDPDFSEWYYEGKTDPPSSGKTNGEYFHLVEDWYDVGGLSHSPHRTDGKPDWYSFYGGDVAGLRAGLDYLEDLGITIIYLNPLFESKSSHKYDAVDYRVIDPHMGTNEEFAAFVADCHERGIRVVLDLAINHTGETHWAFSDTREKGVESEYWDWYEWHRWPLPDGELSGGGDDYDCWWGFGQMPNLNFDLSRPNPEEAGIIDIGDADPNWPLVNHLLDVAEYWLAEIGVDGYRLDVAGEVPFWFWELFRERVKSVKPDAYINGELWGASPEYVNGRYYDAVMNYEFFRNPVLGFIAHESTAAEDFDRALAPGRLIYAQEGVLAQMNLVGSHDTARFLRECDGNTAKVRLAALFAMTYVGAPHLYYGDEIAMDGGGDPDCRRTFLWNWAEDLDRVEMHDYFRDLISIRREHSCLVYGSFETLLARGPVYAYRRDGEDGSAVVVMNVSDRDVTVNVPLGAVDETGGSALTVIVRDAVSGESVQAAEVSGELVMTITLPPYAGSVFIPGVVSDN
ncbi:hypothetical protein K8S17_06260 [bacterium]|nr:hypothetical protein [bacterium]